jgi:hypothetical protein
VENVDPPSAVKSGEAEDGKVSLQQHVEGSAHQPAEDDPEIFSDALETSAETVSASTPVSSSVPPETPVSESNLASKLLPFDVSSSATHSLPTEDLNPPSPAIDAAGDATSKSTLDEIPSKSILDEFPSKNIPGDVPVDVSLSESSSKTSEENSSNQTVIDADGDSIKNVIEVSSNTDDIMAPSVPELSEPQPVLSNDSNSVVESKSSSADVLVGTENGGDSGEGSTEQVPSAESALVTSES